LEFVAFLIVITYALYRILGYPEKKRTSIRFAIIALAGWCAEATCILSYGFYSYSPAWRILLGNVPVLIMLVWPAVIQSAWDLASQLSAQREKRVPSIAAGIVCTDAALIEPLAVNAGLWQWNQPGIFQVPLIGLFGWACFAYLCIQTFSLRDRKVASEAFNWALWVVPVLGVHLMLICSWWVVFRWIDAPLDPMVVTAAAWGISIILSGLLFRSGLSIRIEKKTLLSRIPATVFILGLLAASPGTGRYLPLYAAAFVLPYLTVMAMKYS